MTVVGARPQFIKCGPVSVALQGRHTEILVHTGQHYDVELSEVFFRELGLPTPHHSLGIGSGSHGHQTGLMLAAIEDVLTREMPDHVLVYGDTNSTLAATLAAAKLNLPVAHIEAGLRSFNRDMPEEVNRVVVDHLSMLLFCPSDAAARNLAAEGITQGVHVVGDVMLDALELWKMTSNRNRRVLQRLELTEGDYLLATVHRAENTNDPDRLRRIIEGLQECGTKVVFPLHPRTRAALDAAEIDWRNSPILFTESVGYFDMLTLQASARVIATDSGGVQKEAYWLGVPCVTLRQETEWVETVASGWNTIVDADPAKIVRAARLVGAPPARPHLYGDGESAARIADVLTACGG